MKKLFILFLPAALLLQELRAQELVVDPACSAAIAINSATINGQLKTTNNNLGLISKGQLAVSGQLLIANDLQNKIYKGLSEVASVMRNLASVKDIADCGEDIVRDMAQAMTLAKSDPLLLALAQQGAVDFEARAAMLAAEVGAFVLRGGADNLMDSGERGKLLNHIDSQMRILRGAAYGMQRAMYWVKMRGVFNALDPWATWRNMDMRIASDVVSQAKYLKP